MYADDCSLLTAPQSTKFSIRPPEPSQRELFLKTYLRAFEAQEDRLAAAIRNMLHLFDRPELDFLIAWHDQTIAGVAMTMRNGSATLLCAGAALPEYREMGCHAALLGARIRFASASGCRQIYSWAALGGQSQSNIEKAGLSVVGTTTTWRFSPESRV
jgi:N-acetylglutamate synthase-like GNAT family acetyltransferase